VYVVFNELSVKLEINKITSSEVARKVMNDFIDFLRELKKIVKGVITFDAFYELKITTGYGINEWLKDPAVEQRRKQLFRTFLNASCKCVDKNDYLDGEFKVRINEEKQNALGCQIAISRNEQTVISINTNHLWRVNQIEGEYSRLDDTGQIIISEESMENLSKIEHLTKLATKIKEDRFNRITSGHDLWEEREKLFPDLVFCERVKDDLYTNPEKHHILPVMKRLERLQSYFSTYNGIYMPEELGFDARTESETVRNSDLKRFRKFRMPDGSEAYFFDHISYTGKFPDGRIHFRVEKGICYVGYIGRHLPTPKHKT